MRKLMNDILIDIELLKTAVNIHSAVELNRVLNTLLQNEQAVLMRYYLKKFLAEELQMPMVNSVEAAEDALNKIAHVNRHQLYQKLTAKIYAALKPVE